MTYDYYYYRDYVRYSGYGCVDVAKISFESLTFYPVSQTLNFKWSKKQLRGKDFRPLF